MMTSQFFANRLCAVALAVVAAASEQETAHAAGESAGAPQLAQSTPDTDRDAKRSALAKLIQKRVQDVGRRHLETGEHLIAERRYEAGANEFALSQALTPSQDRLSRLAESLRRADIDREALTLYQNLLQAEPDGLQRGELLDAIAALRAKLGDDGADDAFETAALLHAQQEHAHGLCQQGLFTACSALYARVYALKPLPRLLFNIAQADRRAARLDESVIFYQRFLDEAPLSPLRKEAAQYVAELGPVAFKRPLHKQWWLWTLIVGGVGAATAVGVTAGLMNQRRDPQTDLGVQTPIFSLSR